MNKSYERKLIEFLTTQLATQDIADAFASLDAITATEPVNVFAGIDEDNPPKFVDDNGAGRGLIIIFKASPKLREMERAQKFDIILSVGHRDEELIDLGGGNSYQRGKANNADLAQFVGNYLCKCLQKKWIHPTVCELDIEQLIDNYFPNFVHAITIGVSFPKQYRQSIFQ